MSRKPNLCEGTPVMRSTRRFVLTRALRHTLTVVTGGACLTTMAGSAIAQWAPGYTFDLRVAGSGAKDVTVQNPCDTITMDLFVHVRGNDGNLTNDGLND